MKTSSLSRREKLLLTLLTSTLVFSASFSYGAVNQNKVDAIMKMITDGWAKFSEIPVSGQSKSERTQYFEKVDAGLWDAVEMLAVVRNNIRSLMGLSPAYTADDIVGSILGSVIGGVGGNTGTTTNPPTWGPGPVLSSFLPFMNNCPSDVQPFWVFDIRVRRIEYSGPTNIARAPNGKPIVIAFSVPKDYTTKDLATFPSIRITHQDGLHDWTSVGMSVSTNPCANKPIKNSTNDGYGRWTFSLYTSDDTRRPLASYVIIPGQMNYITLFPEADTPPADWEVQPTQWGTMVHYTNANKPRATGGFEIAWYGTIDAVRVGTMDFQRFQPGLPTTFPTGSTPHLVGNGGGIVPAVTVPGPVASSFVPFVNNCPADVGISAGWNIRTPLMRFASSAWNLLTARTGKPIVIALDVPKGYTTVWTTQAPNAGIGQYQSSYSVWEVSVSISTSSCIAWGDFIYQWQNYQFFTPDDPRSKDSYYDANRLIIIPGQVNYITVRERSTQRAAGDNMWGITIDYLNSANNWWNPDMTDTSLRQIVISNSNFSPFTAWIRRTFPTGSTPHLVGTGGGTSTPPVVTPPPVAVVTNPIANYPIPAPCPSGTVLNQELMGVNNGQWIRRYAKAAGHVYKLRIDEEDGAGNGVVQTGPYLGNSMINVKISPYPCDFVTLAEEKKYHDGRISVAPVIATWWNNIVVPPGTTVWACTSMAISNNFDYKIGSAFANPNLATLWATCTLLKWVTYYVNITPTYAELQMGWCGNGCSYDLMDRGNQRPTTLRQPWWGNISSLSPLISSQNVEALRQAVVRDYATRGVNMDGLTNTALGGTAIVPPVGASGGPVIVREGPWERIEDIWCPPTLTGATDGLQILYPNGYNYSNQGNTYWNVKDYQKPTDISLPAICTTGKKFVKHGMTATCYLYECKN
jgi:hypothetical protein